MPSKVFKTKSVLFFMDTFVNLPVYEGLKSYQTLKYDDFKENYLLYISCFQLKKHLKLIESRIIKNFEKKIYLEESFQILDEICGFEKRNIFKNYVLLNLIKNGNMQRHINYTRLLKWIFSNLVKKIFSILELKKNPFCIFFIKSSCIIIRRT